MQCRQCVFEDGTVDAICQMYENVVIVPSISYHEEKLSKKLPKDISNGTVTIPAGIIDEGMINPRVPMIITELDDMYTLSEIKILLSKYYTDEHQIKLYDKNGVHDIAVYEMDRNIDIDHTSKCVCTKREYPVRKYDLYDLKDGFLRD